MWFLVFFWQCLTSLQQGQCGGWPEAVELVSLLSRYEVEGLLYAHDRIAEASTISTAPLSGGHHEAVLDYPLGDFNQTMPESSFISSTSLTSHSPAHSASSSSQPPDRTFKIIRLEKSNEPLVNTYICYQLKCARFLNRVQEKEIRYGII